MAITCDECERPVASTFTGRGNGMVLLYLACSLHDTDVVKTIRSDPRGLRWTWERQVTYTIWNNEVVFERKS